MRISDWSSDVCSSDLAVVHQPLLRNAGVAPIGPRCRQAGAALQEQGEGRSRNRCDRRRPTGGAGGQGARFREAGGSLLAAPALDLRTRSEEHTSELQSLMRISYAVFCLKKKTTRSNKEDR